MYFFYWMFIIILAKVYIVRVICIHQSSFSCCFVYLMHSGRNSYCHSIGCWKVLVVTAQYVKIPLWAIWFSGNQFMGTLWKDGNSSMMQTNCVGTLRWLQVSWKHAWKTGGIGGPSLSEDPTNNDRWSKEKVSGPLEDSKDLIFAIKSPLHETFYKKNIVNNKTASLGRMYLITPAGYSVGYIEIIVFHLINLIDFN